ncbi:MAG: 4-hydroxythreonine-4-phosphate dehydrogenase PdxA, partial [bacterium]
KKAVKNGISAQGPYPADTVFHSVVNGHTHDAVVCMYHDQGLIPVKLLYFDSGVNITLGLPIVRTSPDHGTAYDIAGRGCASAGSITCAFKTAVEIAKNRKK